jgi:hypothetical protein
MFVLRRRRTELTESQRLALREASLLLTRFFPGETVQVYVPQMDRAARFERIATALQGGEPLSLIAKREGISSSRVKQIRTEIRESLPR